MGKFEPLRRHFENIPDTVNEITLSFSEIETILGNELPPAAYKYRPWWANPANPAQHPYAQSWLRAGWKVDKVNQTDNWVRFRRILSHTVEKETPFVVISPPRSSTKEDISSGSSATLLTNSKQFLLNFGFEKVGEWVIRNDSIQCVLTQHGHEKNILYAFVAEEEVKYIGKSTLTLRERMNGYQQPRPIQRTNIKNNARIKVLLRQKIPVHILVFVHDLEMTYQGILINLAAGLEDNLIARVNPPWNKRE